jgi:hypothetical protein
MGYPVSPLSVQSELPLQRYAHPKFGPQNQFFWQGVGGTPNTTTLHGMHGLQCTIMYIVRLHPHQAYPMPPTCRLLLTLSPPPRAHAPTAQPSRCSNPSYG